MADRNVAQYYRVWRRRGYQEITETVTDEHMSYITENKQIEAKVENGNKYIYFEMTPNASYEIIWETN